MNKTGNTKKGSMKPLCELNLLDRFLFACTMEDPKALELVLSIIMEKEIVLTGRPQAEKELRTAPWLRSVRLDVYTMDDEEQVYNAEVQKQNTGNLIKRSRFYQALIDSTLLAPGEIDFNNMQPSYLITIMPFDLFGKGLYKYTFSMRCREYDDIFLEDGSTRIFLNTRGTSAEGAGPELIELLHYMENTSGDEASKSQSKRIKELHRRVSEIRASEEIGVKYMQEWEERAYERREARAEGMKEGEEKGLKEGEAKGLEEGKAKGLEEGIKAFILDYLEEGKTEAQILHKLQHRFSLGKDAANEYLMRFASHPGINR